jgi:hypothetical protein
MAKQILARYTIPPFTGPTHDAQAEKGWDNPCAICGKNVKEEGKEILYFGHVIEGGDAWGTGIEGEGSDGGDMGLFPIGPDCYRKYHVKGTEKAL